MSATIALALGALALTLIGAALVTPATAAPSCPLPIFGPGADYHPVINPASFSPNVDNPLFPLTPGTTLVYTGTKDGKTALNIFTTTSRTKAIDGVTTRVVEDRLYLTTSWRSERATTTPRTAAATSGTSVRTLPRSTSTERS